MLHSGYSLANYVGGSDEALLAGGGKLRLILKNRMGFVQAAVAAGAPLVPCLAFGENALFRQIFSHRLRGLQVGFSKIAPGGMSLPVFRNESWFSLPMKPHRVPTVMVIGEPVLWEGVGIGVRREKEPERFRRVVGVGVCREKEPERFRRVVGSCSHTGELADELVESDLFSSREGELQYLQMKIFL